MLLLTPLAKLGGLTYTSARVVGAFVGAGAVAVVGLVGRRLAGERAGLIAAGVAAAYPAWVVGDTSGMSEGLYLLLVAAALLALLDRRAVLAGLAIGLATLTRSEGLLLVPLAAWPLLWGRRAAVATGVVLLVLAPWAIRNTVQLDRFVPVSTNDATVVAGANCPPAYHGRDTGSWVPACLSLVRPSTDEGVLAARWQSAGLHYAKHHAGRVPAVAAVRVLRTWRLWQPLRAPVSEGENRIADKVAALWFLILLLPAGALGMWRAPLAARDRLLLGALLVLITLTSAIGWGSPRFARPAELGLMLAAAAYVAATRDSPSGARPSRPT